MQVFPALRIKDENGFISDSFVEIDNGDEKVSKANIIPLVVGGILVVVVTGGVMYLRKKK